MQKEDLEVKVIADNQRVQRFVGRHLKSAAYRWHEVSDPRESQGRRWKHTELLNALLLGFVSGCGSLRKTEQLTKGLGRFGRKYVSRRAPDTTLSDFIPRLSVEEVREQHIVQVKASWRKKELKPVGLPCGVATIDGKGLGALSHSAEETAQLSHREDGTPYYLSRVFRAVLTSAESRPCLDQMAIGAKTNEAGDFIPFYDKFLKSYGDNNDLFEIVDVDAGMTSKANADRIYESQKAYVMALKENQPVLYAEAERVLGNRRKVAAETPWESYQGKRIKRRLFVTYEMAGYHDWTHLKQVWRVEQITKHPGNKKEREQRYFLSSLHQGRLTPEQILLVVRGHWRVENDCFWSLDVQWNEDSAPWCRTGRSTEILSWIRLMAYNLMQKLRRRHMRKKLPDGKREAPPPWNEVFAWINQVWHITPEPITARG
jgi:predicted transposase YbfD/YdcC